MMDGDVSFFLRGGGFSFGLSNCVNMIADRLSLKMLGNEDMDGAQMSFWKLFYDKKEIVLVIRTRQ